jgi:hypothetical protein
MDIAYICQAYRQQQAVCYWDAIGMLCLVTCGVTDAIAPGADGPKAATVNDRRGKCGGRKNDFRQSLVRYVLVYRRHRQTLHQQQRLECQDLSSMLLGKLRGVSSSSYICVLILLVSSIAEVYLRVHCVPLLLLRCQYLSFLY